MDPRRLEEAAKDLATLEHFVAVYCEGHHAGELRSPWEPPRVARPLFPGERPELCRSCTGLLGYSLGRRLVCPQHPKPACKACPEPCYRPGHREQMRAVMRYSGWRLILRGHWRLLWKYFF